MSSNGKLIKIYKKEPESGRQPALLCVAGSVFI